MRDALSILDQLSKLNKRVEYDDVISTLGTISNNDIKTLIDDMNENNAENIKNKLQTMINGLDLNSLNTLFDQVGEVFAKENAETMEMLGELKDFKDVIKKN